MRSPQGVANLGRLMVDINTALQDAEADLAKFERSRTRLDEQIKAVKLEIAGLTAARNRYVHGQAERVAAEVSSADEWGDLTRTDAVLKIMATINRPASPTDIAKLLVKMGREENTNPVAAALAYLHQKGKVESLRRGAWVLASYKAETNEVSEANGDA